MTRPTVELKSCATPPASRPIVPSRRVISSSCSSCSRSCNEVSLTACSSWRRSASSASTRSVTSREFSTIPPTVGSSSRFWPTVSTKRYRPSMARIRSTTGSSVPRVPVADLLQRDRGAAPVVGMYERQDSARGVEALRVAEQPGTGRTGRPPAVVRIEHRDDVGGVLDEGPITRLALLQRTFGPHPLRHVADDHDRLERVDGREGDFEPVRAPFELDLELACGSGAGRDRVPDLVDHFLRERGGQELGDVPSVDAPRRQDERRRRAGVALEERTVGRDPKGRVGRGGQQRPQSGLAGRHPGGDRLALGDVARREEYLGDLGRAQLYQRPRVVSNQRCDPSAVRARNSNVTTLPARHRATASRTCGASSGCTMRSPDMPSISWRS